MIRDTAKEIAESKKRKFVEWNKLTKEEKDNVFNNVKDYFVLLDIRLSEFDSSDIKGLPDFDGEHKSSIEWKSPFWAKLLEQKDSDGFLFFDEMNLAPPLVISSVYKIIYDRVINSGKISEDWLIMGAGNLAEDRAFTHDLASPVRDRGGEVELQPPTADDWTDWAVDNSIDSRIIAYINFKNDALHPKTDFEDKQKFTTARGWERVNTLIKDITDLKSLELVCSTAIGEGISKEFVAFIKISNTIKLEEVIKNPEKFKEIKDISVKYFVLTAMAERYKTKGVKFDTIMKSSEVLDGMGNAEFVALLWRLCMRYEPTRFKKDFLGSKFDKKIFDKYRKFLL